MCLNTIAMNSLMKLNIYTDSDSEEETERRHQNRLPLPEFLSQSSIKKPSSQQVNLDGKVRNFPHEPGNWATYIYLPLDSSSGLISYLGALSSHFQALNLKAVDDFHISLTRTVTLRHHWILDFTKSVQKNLAQVTQFEIHLFGLKAYTNEQKTRSFLSLTVAEGQDDLKMVVSHLDNCLREYSLQCFYDDPSFHVSLLWCPGEKCNEINKYIDLLPVKLKNFGLHMCISHCVCASGNKKFNFWFNQ